MTLSGVDETAIPVGNVWAHRGPATLSTLRSYWCGAGGAVEAVDEGPTVDMACIDRHPQCAKWADNVSGGLSVCGRETVGGAGDGLGL